MSKVTFNRVKDVVYQSTETNASISDRLEAGVYAVKFDQDRGCYFLQQIEDFKVPTKIYGKAYNYTDRFINTYRERTSSTGVLLSGEKGSGKTIQAKHISIQMAEKHNAPTIVVNDPFCNEAFKEFIQNIHQECVVLFDEYEKVYRDKEHQEALLTILDGVIQTKKLFVFTINDRFSFNEYLINRPGRVFYRIQYTGVDAETITQYCQENLNNKEWEQNVHRIARAIRDFNFDTLKAVVEESNRYNEAPDSFINILNADVCNNMRESKQYLIEVYKGDKLIHIGCDSGDITVGNVYVGFTDQTAPKVGGEYPDFGYDISYDDFAGITDDGIMIFNQEDGYTIAVKQQERKKVGIGVEQFSTKANVGSNIVAKNFGSHRKKVEAARKTRKATPE
jgi:DNA replication protein DnaC